MTKFFWNALKLSSVILSASLLLANRTQAATPVVQLATDSSTAATSIPTNTSLKQLVSSVPAGTAAESPEGNQMPQQVAGEASDGSQPAQNTEAPEALSEETSVTQLSAETPDEIAQVTSVSQLSDVQPTDWAFQALQSLVERYGCIVGYPDSTYRGNRALTRYEFAAGLNSCLDRVNELIAAGTSDLVRREDLATLQRLQEEFSAEVATLRGRVDGLEARTAELEANQFSTTTKLTGEAIFNIGGAFGDERAVPSGRPDPTDNPDSPDIDDIVTFSGRVRLALNTSFFGTDLLRTRLQARNITAFGTNVTGTNMTRLAFDGDENNTFNLDQLFYRFPLFTDRIIAQVDVANTELDNRGFPTLSPFESSGRGSISRYGRFSPIYRQGAGGAGVSFAINREGPISLNLAYLAPTANNPNSGFGVANGAYAAIGQVTIKPIEAFSLGLTYAHTYDTPTRRTPQLFESTGGIFANAPFGITPTTGNHYGVEASLRLTPGLILFGWGGYTQAIAEGDPDAGAAINGTAITGNRGSKADIWYYAGGIALPDFGKEGSLLGVLFGQSPRVADNDVREVGFGNRRRIDNDTSYHAEGFYRFKLTDNIDIQPGVMVILNPEHNDDNPTEYVGTIRTTFTF